MRRIDESIESLTPEAGSAPLAFRWRGRRYVVGTVLAHWVETGAWWRRPSSERGSDASTSTGAPVDPERWLFRVEACRGSHTGVFDLCLEVDGHPGGAAAVAPERWSLHAIYD